MLFFPLVSKKKKKKMSLNLTSWKSLLCTHYLRMGHSQPYKAQKYISPDEMCNFSMLILIHNMCYLSIYLLELRAGVEDAALYASSKFRPLMARYSFIHSFIHQYYQGDRMLLFMTR